MSIGRWAPVTAENSSNVLAQVNEFVESFRMLSGSIPSPDMVEATERRIQQMLKSASLRLDIITSYVDAHPNCRNDKLMAAARALTVMLAHEGIGIEKEVVSGPNSSQSLPEPSSVVLGDKSAAVVSAMAGAKNRLRSGSVSFMCNANQPTVAPVNLNPSSSFRRSPTTPRKRSYSQSPNSALNPNAASSFLQDEGNDSIVDVRQVITPLTNGSHPSGADGDGRMEMYLQQLKTREEALKYKLQFSTEREHDVLQKLMVMEQENLRLERALVEVNESRERMKGLVEEQVYTQALHTRLMGLLHLEKNRTSRSTLTRGVLFWGVSVLVALYLLTTWAQPTMQAYIQLRTAVTMALPYWTALILDCAVVSLLIAFSHEWITYAVFDLCNGSSNWVISTLSAYTEEQAVITDDTRSVASSKGDSTTSRSVSFSG
eukprot:TRINITY_DN30683_c0_g1_i1.p1 TRINITY_DN30683_c0_g1~~TRINITY_DN30683_c0_g1_i1.p1  ORF type:complete len:431 (+),score=130.39 TRINITY_DN30683_c0_g1_i1:39-1331(+)